MRTFRYVLCDVFTERALTGNPLAVFTDARGLSAATQQALSREMNLSESVFVFPPEAGGHAKLRIYTPTHEMPFAGHPTLGTAFVLGGPLQVELIRLETGIGIIPVRLEREAARIAFGWMEQRVPSVSAIEQHRAELLDALGLAQSELPILEYDNGARHLYVTVPSFEAVRSVTPDIGRLARITKAGVNVSAIDGARAKTRMFAPALGVAEDPATGSAAGPLAVHFATHAKLSFGDTLHIEQGTEIWRPSELYARVSGSANAIESVEVGGSAVIVGRGELRIP
jgi:trans-2,3-dihydro-3-hydroxyanthranilate isomerase